jgi:translocation and assembly module TamA
MLLGGGLILLGASAQGADPVKYTVKFAPSGDAALDGLLQQTSSLVRLRSSLPPAPFTLIGRAQADEQKFLTVLHSLGYDAGAVDITINGTALNDPTLPNELDQAPATQTATVLVSVRRDGQFHLGRVDVIGLPPGFAPPPLVKPGDVALAAPIIAASPALRKALRNAGYAFAKVSNPPLAVADPVTQTLNVTYTVEPGPRVNIGVIDFAGLKRTDEKFLLRHIALRPGERYSDTAIQTARDSLLGLGVFASVTPVPQDHPGPDSEVPILFRVVEQKRHAVTLSGLYATDTGFTVGTSWEDRNVFRHAETLTLSATANGLGGSGSVSPGYDLKAVYAKPDYYARGQTLTISLEGLNESLTAYDRTAALAGVSLSRPITPHTSITFGLAFVDESVTQQGISRIYVLAQFPVTFSYNTVNSLLEPTRGVNASLTLTPTVPLTNSNSSPFFIARASAATYLQVEKDARGIIALRGQVGTIQGTSQFQVPADQRFYAGGSGTIRGYTYQTVGPLFPDDTPEGGLAIDTFSVELRQHITEKIGIVPFVDAGQVSASSAPFTGTLRVGVGLGGRYYTAIGPLRLDIAFPVTRVAGSSAFAAYVGLGEAF